ncbi:DUF3575 domain-containing protein [Bacteroides uniformis]|uniref:DUF3575 domain-containing protein n=1 Tax=Bacteroides uniformis TaxID=820 RepID=UPI001D074201|nr:DUF3575 domain-containing protein [Bacteroides uniformis]MCB6980485.1 DUF3575 domain-containing protein [Bacteroides uniformis]MCB7028302.1 DUF3575 domain-containing protein [Bacteroides uniformis]
MRIKKNCISLILLLFGIHSAYPQEKRTEIRVDFRANSTVIDPDYNGNARHLDEIVSFFGRMEADSTVNIINVSFCGTASPEGSHQLNKRLAHERMEALETLVRSRISIPDSLITREDEYIPWEYLAEMIAQSDITHKGEIIAIINGKSEIVDYPGGRHIDSRIPALQKLDDGKAWRELLNRFFAPMRNACAVFITFKKEAEPVAPTITIPEVVEMADTVPEPFPVAVDAVVMASTETPTPEQWNRRLHLKTNALGLALAIANVAAEVDLARHWSFTLPVYYSAWDYFSHKVKFRTFALQPEARYWPREENDGLFAGAHLGLAYYNFATGGDYRTQDHDRETPAWGGGLSVGYRLPLSRNSRWKMEFSVGAGVYPAKYDKFINGHNGLLAYTDRKTYVGLDQLNISIAYTFNTFKKGGKR